MYEYTIKGGEAFAELWINLGAGQTIKAEGGAMSYMDGTVQMETQSGGFFKGIKRAFSGESFFQNLFTGPGNIVFAPSLPGSIIELDINVSNGWLLQRDGYIASSPNIEVSSKWGGLKSMFGGEGAILTHVGLQEGGGNKGTVFAGGYGSIQKHEVPSGKEFVVDTGIFFATEDTTQFKTSKVGGTKSFFFGGEGLVMRFTGPCTVYTQSRGQDSLLSFIMSHIPSSS